MNDDISILTTMDIYRKSNAIKRTVIAKLSNNEKPTLVDTFMMQGSFYVQALYNENLLCPSELERHSIDETSIIRGLYEALGILTMYDFGDIDSESEMLLLDVSYIINHELYDSYRGLSWVNEFIKKQDSMYYSIKEMYRSRINKTDEEFNRILKSSLPWLKKEVRFADIIKKYMPSMYDDYIKMSIIVHPNHIALVDALLYNLDYKEMFKEITSRFLYFADKYYPNIKIIKKDDVDLIYEIGNTPEIKMLTNHSADIFVDFIRVDYLISKEFSGECIGKYYSQYGRMLYNLLIDNILVVPMISKCRIKPLYELMAMHNFYLKSDLSQELDELLYCYTSIAYSRLNNEEPTDIINKAYEIYKSKFKRNLSLEDFNIKFNKSLGFLGKRKSINSFVFDFIDEVIPDSDSRGLLKLGYLESQASSHANGYWCSLTSGSSNPTLIFIYMLINVVGNMKDKQIAFIKRQAQANNKNYNKLIYDLKKADKELIEDLAAFLALYNNTFPKECNIL